MIQSNISPKIAIRIVYELDQYARQYDESQYGLPVHSEGARKELTAIVLRLIKPKVIYQNINE